MISITLIPTILFNCYSRIANNTNNNTQGRNKKNKFTVFKAIVVPMDYKTHLQKNINSEQNMRVT